MKRFTLKHLLIPLLLLSTALCYPGTGAVTVTNPGTVIGIMNRQSSQVVDHITIGDSNSERTRGWPHGIQWAMLDHYGPGSMMGSGMFSFNERNSTSSTGYQLGYSAANSGTDIRTYHPNAVNVHPMPDALRAYWDASLDSGSTKNHIHPKWYTLADRSVTFNNEGGSGFTYGETITGGTSGDTGIYRYQSGGTIYYNADSGDLVNGETITGGSSSTTADLTGAPATISPSVYQWPEPGIYVKSVANPVGWPTVADRTIPIGSVTGTFTNGETVTQTGTGATGVYRFESNSKMYFTYSSGTFNGSGELTGGTSGATTTPSDLPSTYTGEGLTWRVWAGVFHTGDYDAGDIPEFGWVRGYINTVQQKFWSASLQTSFVATTHSLIATQLNPEPMQYAWPADYVGGGADLQFLEVASSPNYPKALFWHELVRTGATHGWKLSQLYDVSGSDSEDALRYLEDMTDARIGHWLKSVGHRADELSQTPSAVVWLMHGVNGVTHGQSKAAFKSSTQQIILRLRAAWTLAGYDTADLGFILFPSHPVDDPGTGDEATLELYRDACVEIATSDSHVMAIDLGVATDSTELAASGMPRYDDPGTDQAHLEENNSDSDNSYSVLAQRVIQTAAVAADLTPESIADAVWKQILDDMDTVGSVGKRIGDNLDATVSSRSTFDDTTDTVDVGKISGDSGAANSLEALLDGTGADLDFDEITGSKVEITNLEPGGVAVKFSASGAGGSGLMVAASDENGSAVLLSDGSGIGVRADAGMTGLGSAVATSILETPANKIVTDGNGNVRQADVDGVSDSKFRQLLLAYVASSKTTVTDNGDGTYTYTIYQRDGVTPLLEVIHNNSGEWSDSTIDP